MKRLKFIISLFIILVLLATSTVGLFALPTNNTDNRKANVAIINEDNGAVIDGKQFLFGSDFTQLFAQNTDGNYEVTSRTAGLEGLNNKKYDLLIIVPSNFTEKAMTYNSEMPEKAFLEYIKSPTSSQVESLKSEVVTKILKETANKVLVETFTFEILKTMQAMQGKSLNIIENELNYQTYFQKNVELPMTTSITQFDSLLSELSTQQSSLEQFDTNVKSFQNGVQLQSEEEKKHLSHFEGLKDTYQEMTKKINNWSEDYDKTFNFMRDDQYLDTVQNLQEVGREKLKQSIQNIKRNTVQLEFQMRAMEDYREKLDRLNKEYIEIKKTGKVILKPVNENDVHIQEMNNKLQNILDQVGSLTAPNSPITSALNTITEEGSGKTKEKIETEIAKACHVLPLQLGLLPEGYTKQEFEAAKSLCATAKLEMNNDTIPLIKAVYRKQYEHKIKGNQMQYKINTDSDKISAKYHRQSDPVERTMEIGKVEQFEGTPDENDPIIMTIEYYEERPYSTTEKILDHHMIEKGVTVETWMNVLLKEETNIFPFENMRPLLYGNEGQILTDGLRPKQKEAIEGINQLNMLTLLYYGKTPNDLLNSYLLYPDKKSVLPSDSGISGNSGGIQKFRPYAILTPVGGKIVDKNGNKIDGEWTGSLIAQLEKTFNYQTLEIEVTKAIASQLSESTTDVIKHVDEYILALKERTDGGLDMSKLPDGIYKDQTQTAFIEPSAEYYLDRDIKDVRKGSYNAIIADMESQYGELLILQKQLDDFTKNFTDWIDHYGDIAGESIEITNIQENDNRVVISLEENQSNLLSGVVDLQKQIENQFTQTKQIMTSADDLKKESDQSKVKIDESTKKLSVTKQEFDKTLAENKQFVDQFIKKYTSSLNGGADNQAFYQNYAKPVEVNGKDVHDTNSLVAFFLILLMTVFSLVIAYFFNQWKMKKTNDSEHINDSIFSGIAAQIGMIILTSIIAGGIVGYIGIQALTIKDMSMVMWFTLIVGISITFTVTFYMLLLRFKTYGILVIGMVMLMYFITNGALGLNINANPKLSFLQWLNPLIYFEQPLQNIIFQKETQLLSVFAVLFVVTLLSIAIIYILQPFAYKKEVKEQIS